MVKSQYVSLQDASLVSNKSPQTIRRMIKANKIRYRKYKTPQGFTYLVEKNSLMNFFEMEEADPTSKDVILDSIESNEDTEEGDFELVEENVPENRPARSDNGVYAVRIEPERSQGTVRPFMGDAMGSQPQGGFLGNQTGNPMNGPLNTHMGSTGMGSQQGASLGSQPSSTPLNGSAGYQGQNSHASAQFQGVISQLVQQHREDKKRLFELLEIFQKRIHILEDQLKQLEAPKVVKPPWYRRLLG